MLQKHQHWLGERLRQMRIIFFCAPYNSSFEKRGADFVRVFVYVYVYISIFNVQSCIYRQPISEQSKLTGVVAWSCVAFVPEKREARYVYHPDL